MRVLPLLCVLAACAGKPDPSDSDTDDPDAGTLRAQLAGTWLATDPGFLQFGPQPILDHLTLGEDGRGMLTARHDPTGALVCDALRWETVGESLLVDAEASEYAIYLYNGLYGVDFDGDTVTFTSQTGATATFTRGAAEDGRDCILRTDEAVLGPLEHTANGDSDLVYDAAQDLFWYGDRIDPVIHAVSPTGAPVTVTEPTFSTSNLKALVAVGPAPDTFWFRSPSAEDTLVCRTGADADCGSIDTGLLGNGITIKAATRADTTLWLTGRATGNLIQLLEVDPAGPTLLRTVTFDIPMTSLTWDGALLWGAPEDRYGPVVAIDPATGKAASTHRLGTALRLLRDVEGLAVAGGALWVMMSRDEEENGKVYLHRLAPVP